MAEVIISISTKVWDRAGINSQPLDLLSDTLPTALRSPAHSDGIYYKPTPEYCFCLRTNTDLDRILYSEVFKLGLHCLPKYSKINVLKF